MTTELEIVLLRFLLVKVLAVGAKKHSTKALVRRYERLTVMGGGGGRVGLEGSGRSKPHILRHPDAMRVSA
ncbi:unnamed protein product [Cuscuta campestris]|uniref:Secreted protein n=1 Tax=Cuscuta campestris TaxID=132261 RepID=A0A484K8E9_9ASTE|nr:unnamed protein product [Cuscuta campestris]